MATYRTTVILKTDVVDSTLKLAEQTQAEMGLHKKQHKQFISETANKHHGAVLQEEGDAYWIEFPSVTDAALAGVEMHQNLRSMQAGKGEKQRLAIRAIITVGDVLRQEKDTIGMSMNLTTRIEKITPPDEIYLSQAAWMMLSKAEVQTSFVGEFNFKGFTEPEKVYRVDQKSGLQVLTDQYIVLADARGFSKFYMSVTAERIEEFLVEYDRLMNDMCTSHGGVIRQITGDQYFMTFENADLAVTAITGICHTWKSVLVQYDVGLSMGVHKGNLFVFRSYVFGEDINTTEYLSEFGRFFKSDVDRILVVVSGKVIDELKFAGDANMFQELDENQISQEIFKTIHRDERPRKLVVA